MSSSSALVLGRDQRPKIELPRLSHAEIWIAGTSFKPVSATGIGSLESSDNLFITRLRIVPHRSGPLEIPPVLARIDDRSGRSKPLRLTIEPVPLEGRPAGFLGGVGEFSVQATALPASVRVGQELIYRIAIKGPAAWGSTLRPDLGRFDRIPLDLRVENLPDERTNEPPSMTFVYRIRPTRGGTEFYPPCRSRRWIRDQCAISPRSPRACRSRQPPFRPSTPAPSNTRLRRAVETGGSPGKSSVWGWLLAPWRALRLSFSGVGAGQADESVAGAVGRPADGP